MDPSLHDPPPSARQTPLTRWPVSVAGAEEHIASRGTPREDVPLTQECGGVRCVPRVWRGASPWGYLAEPGILFWLRCLTGKPRHQIDEYWRQTARVPASPRRGQSEEGPSKAPADGVSKATSEG